MLKGFLYESERIRLAAQALYADRASRQVKRIKQHRSGVFQAVVNPQFATIIGLYHAVARSNNFAAGTGFGQCRLHRAELLRIDAVSG